MDTAQISLPDNEPLDETLQGITRSLRVIYRANQQHSRWVEKQCGVSGPQLWAMWELYLQPGLKVSELSAALSIHQSTASNMLDKLEHKGLIRRERSEQDHRVVRLYLTEAGTNSMASAPQPAQGAINHALSQLPDRTLQHLHSGLQQLINAMEMADKDAGYQLLAEH